MKRKVDYHPSVIIVQSDKTGKLLLSGYDQGYPQELFRGSTNLIGGNPSPEEESPLQVLQREIFEEIQLSDETLPPYLKGRVTWANKEDINTLSESILIGIQSFADFYISAEHIRKGTAIPYSAIYSAFYSEIPEDVMEMTHENLRLGKQMVTEGTLGVYKLENLANRGEYGNAHGTPMILESRFGLYIPRPKSSVAEQIGIPRESFQDYFKEFDYQSTWLKV
ncbi:MAG: NUDIX domain-containing protein [Nanoarchaeota archaeon]